MKNTAYSKENKPLTIDIISNGLILPRIEVDAANDIRWGLGGVLDTQDVFVTSSFYDGGWAKHGGYYAYDNNQVEYLDLDVVYLGLFHSHWGHFLIDCITRVWFIYQLAQKKECFKFAYLGEEIPSGNNLRFFELLGINEDQLLHIEKPTRCRNVYIPEQGFKSCDWYSQEHLDMLNGVVKSVLDSDYDFSRVRNLEKVYFTRRSFSKAIESEFGEKYIEQTFLGNGYKAVAPERLTLDEQIFLWNHASSICCVNGSIPLNVLFACNPKIDLIVLNKTSLFHENPLILLQMRQIHPVFIDVYLEPISGYPKSLGEGPFLFSATPEFEQFCNQRNWSVQIRSSGTKLYFLQERIKFIICIWGIKKKIRLFLSRYIPSSVKNLVRRLFTTIK